LIRQHIIIGHKFNIIAAPLSLLLLPPPTAAIGSPSDGGTVVDDEAETPLATSLPLLFDPNNNKVIEPHSVQLLVDTA
jgi:hypothetical protein